MIETHLKSVTPGEMCRRRFLGAGVAACVTLGAEALAKEERSWRVGVIGHTGRGNYGHGLDTVWRDVEQTEIVAVADKNPAGLEAAQKRLACGQGFADYRMMLAAVRPDIVAVCPRFVDEHRDMILAAIEHGARGIYCEKPFCASLAEADEIAEACERSGTKLALAHRNRYHPVLPTIKEMITRGEIGKLLEVRGRGKEDHRGGVLDLWVLGTHIFNLASVFVGPPVACSANYYSGSKLATRDDVREGDEGIGAVIGDRLHARYETASGVPFYFDSIRGHGVAAAGFGFQLIGNEGVIDFRIDQAPLAHVRRGNPYQPQSQASPWLPISSAGVGEPEPDANAARLVANHVTPVRDLLAAIVEDRAPLCSERDGRVTLEYVFGTFASHVDSGRRVTLPLDVRTHPVVR